MIPEDPGKVRILHHQEAPVGLLQLLRSTLTLSFEIRSLLEREDRSEKERAKNWCPVVLERVFVALKMYHVLAGHWLDGSIHHLVTSALMPMLPCSFRTDMVGG
ncbi:unnamed protein product [Symbiodinium microadriaticum]|nr:unnamed protein product [Symbiodinium microadriaticum]